MKARTWAELGGHTLTEAEAQAIIEADRRAKSGFEDDPTPAACRHPEHEPPNHLYIPVGKRYRHVCPGCGKERVVCTSTVTL